MRTGLVALIALLPGVLAAADAWRWNVAQIDKRRYVPVSDVAAFYKLSRQVSSSKHFRLVSSSRVIEGGSGSREVLVNGVKYITCFPMRTRGSEVYVSAMDVTKIIEPVMRPGKINRSAPVRTIVLDAGHGGHDSGAVGLIGREKEYALDVVLRARSLLMRSGYQVKLTRSNDTFVPLQERANFANRYSDALFVSVHFNKSNRGGTGLETYALAPRGVPSMDEEGASYSDFKQNPGNARDAENIALAAAVHSSMVKNLRAPDRGIKRARFLVIKNIRIPGVLVEGGFVDNSLDARRIASPDYRQRLAQSILEGVQAYSRAVTGAGPKPTLVVSGDKPSSVPNLDDVPATKPGFDVSKWRLQPEAN